MDEIVESFESAVLIADPDVREFLPQPISDENRRIAIELLCVDMQYRWERSNRKCLEDYRREFQPWLSSPADLQELAMEEFRLRWTDGECPSPEEYRRKYSVDISGWEAGIDTRVDVATGTRVVDLNDALVRLTDAVETFPAVGECVGDFTLVEELGRGTFGIVYLARQGDLEQRLVTLKLTTLGDIESGFLARLQHTHIVPIYSVHRFGGLHGICMPYYGRKTLQDLLNGKKSWNARGLTELDLARLGLQIAEGLRHAHERGILHRDLKPANILLNEDGWAMLLDFNLSQDVISGGRASLMVGGTLPYLAPEHLRAIRSGEPLGPPADIFSLGVVLYQLLGGTLPYPTRHGAFDDAMAQMIKDRHAVRTPLPALNPKVSPGLASIVDKMLAPDTSDRYDSMDRVCIDLQRHLDHRPLKYASNPSLIELATKWRRRHPRLSSATSVSVIALLLISLLVGVLVARGNRIDRQNALAQLNQTKAKVPHVRSLLSMPVVEDVSRQDGIALARDIVNMYGVSASADWRQDTLYTSLTPAERHELEGILGQVLFLLGSAEESQNAATDDVERTFELARSLLSSQQSQRSSERTNNSLFTETIRSLQEFEYEQAIPVLEELRDADPFDVSTWLLLGNVYAAIGRFQDAEGCFNVCVSMWPDSHFGYFQRGLCRLDMSMFSEAESDFDGTLQRRPEYLPALINRAIARREQQKYRAAESDLTEALKRGATQTRIYFLRSQLRRQLRDREGAQADWDRGMKLEPTDEKSWIRRGLERLKHDPVAALEDFKKARQLNPRSHAALRNIAHVYAERQNRQEDALEIINELIKYHHGRNGDLVSRGVLLARMGKRAEALADAKRVLASTPTAKELLQVACIYSLTSDIHAPDALVALALAEQAITEDARWLAVATADPDLQAVRSLPEYQNVVAAARERIQRQKKISQAASAGLE